MAEFGAKQFNTGGPSEDEIRAALARVIASESFASAPKLQQFLSYVVEETVAGRGAAIKGKAIAVDVYDRDIDDVEAGQNLVRVEARRLRRHLGQYFAGPGAEDPWHILIDLGGYTPRFERGAPNTSPADVEPRPAASSPYLGWIALISVVAVTAAAILGATDLLRIGGTDADSAADGARRAAYRERSVQALQAVDLAEQARSMLYPLFDVKRQEFALGMFRHSISLDPDLHHGYAGAAQVLATLALISPDRQSAAAYQEDAMLMANKALQLAPTDPWTHAANAWVLAVSGKPADAMSFARRAVKMAPEDGNVLDFAANAAVMADSPQFAANATSPERNRSGAGRSGANNIWGVAQLMLGNYNEVIEAFSTAPEAGAPVAAPSLIFLAVAYDHVGEATEASRIVAELNTNWPDYPVNHIVTTIFRNSPDTGNDILERLAKHSYEF